MLQGERLTTQDTDKDHHPKAQMKECCIFYLTNVFPEFQSPQLHFFFSPYKEGPFKMECKTVCQGTNLQASQTTSHLNKARIKIQSLSLLIASGSDRQYEHWLSQFQRHYRSSSKTGSMCKTRTSAKLGIVRIHNPCQRHPPNTLISNPINSHSQEDLGGAMRPRNERPVVSCTRGNK